MAIGPNPGTFGGTSKFVSGDTPARKVRYYANMNAGAPDTRAISPSDLDNAIVARKNSVTQSAALFKCEDETGAGICSITPAGQFVSNSPGGSGSNASFEAVGSALPSFDLNNTSAGADQKVWDMAATPAALVLRTINDANNNALPIWVINRKGLGADQHHQYAPVSEFIQLHRYRRGFCHGEPDRLSKHRAGLGAPGGSQKIQLPLLRSLFAEPCKGDGGFRDPGQQRASKHFRHRHHLYF